MRRLKLEEKTLYKTLGKSLFFDTGRCFRFFCVCCPHILALSCIAAFIANHGPSKGGRRSREISKNGNIRF